MKSGLIIINAFTKLDKVLHMVDRFSEEFDKLGVYIDSMTNQQAHIFVNEFGCFEHNLKRYDFVVYLDKDVLIAEMLEREGYRLFNSADAIRLCDDKMLTHISLANHHLKMPKSILYPLRYGEGDDARFLQFVKEQLDYPLIIKKNYGSQGSGVYLVDSDEEFKKVNDELRMEPHLYQQFIASSRGKDTRVILIDHKVVAHMERESYGDFRSNMALGGHASVKPLPKSFEEMAIKASELLKLDYCGVDIATDSDGSPVLLEVNSNAFVSTIEEVTKVNVVGIYAKYIYDTVYQ